MLKNLLVVGGTGYVGRQLCKEAVQSGWQVVSVSRRGAPALSASENPWTQKVSWVSGDMNAPETYEKHLASVSAVVHSVGILFENSKYQDMALHPVSYVKSLIASKARRDATGNGRPSSTEDESRTYESVNRDSVRTLAEACSKYPNVKTFGYISANHAVPPFLRQYIETKAEAEEILAAHDSFSTCVFRPGTCH
jgi:nucleoside-diphosphate-sugar epimerase